MADPSGNMRCAKSEEDLEEGEIADDGYDQLDSRSPPRHLEVPNFTLSEYDQSIHGTSSARGFIKEKADRAGIPVAVHNANAEDSNRSSQFSDPAEQVEDMGQQQLVHIEKVIMESKVALENAYAVRDQLIGLGASGRFENGQNTQPHSATRNPSGTAFDTPYSPPNCNTPSSSESVPTTASEPRKSSSFSPEYMQDYHIEADLVRTGDDTLNLEIRSPLFQIDDDDARSNPDSAKPIDQRTKDLIEAFITNELNDRVDGTESRNLSTKFEMNSRRMHHGRFVWVVAYIWTGSYDRKEEYGDGHPTKYIATPWGLLAVNSYLMLIVDWNEREFWGLPCFAYSKRELDKLPQFIVDDIVPLQRVRLNRGLPSSDRNAGEIRVAYYSGSGSAYLSKKYATFSLHAPMDDAPGFVLNEDFTTLKKILDEKHDEMSLALKTSASIIPQPHKLVEQRRSRESQLSETQEHQGNRVTIARPVSDYGKATRPIDSRNGERYKRSHDNVGEEMPRKRMKLDEAGAAHGKHAAPAWPPTKPAAPARAHIRRVPSKRAGMADIIGKYHLDVSGREVGGGLRTKSIASNLRVLQEYDEEIHGP